MTLNQQLKQSVFDFTNNMSKNIKTLNPNKYQEDVLKTLSKSGLQRLGNTSQFQPRKNGNENFHAQNKRGSRNQMLYTRYNIITNQFQNYNP